MAVWKKKNTLPTTASQYDQQGWRGSTFNKAKIRPSEANPTAAKTILTTHNKARLECSTAQNVNGIQSAEGIRIAA